MLTQRQDYQRLLYRGVLWNGWALQQQQPLLGVPQNGSSEKLHVIHRKTCGIEPFSSKTAALGLQRYFKKTAYHAFLWILPNFSKKPFYGTPTSGDCIRCSFTKEGLYYECFPNNFPNSFRTAILENGWCFIILTLQLVFQKQSYWRFLWKISQNSQKKT